MSERPCISVNRTDIFNLGGNTYGGLPTNLLTNLIGWLVLVLLFVLIRKETFRGIQARPRGPAAAAAGGGRQRPKNKWMYLFFRQNSQEDEEEDSETTDLETVSSRSEPPEPLPEDHEEPAFSDALVTNSHGGSLTSLNPAYTWKDSLKVFHFSFESLEPMLTLDAVHYLRFQAFIILYIVITTVVSIGVIMPINFQGTKQGNSTDFGHTTLANLDPESPALWVHITLAFLLFPLAIFLMRRFSVYLRFRDTSLSVTHTVAVDKIPRQFCSIENVYTHFSEAYPGTRIRDVKVAYNVTRLSELTNRLKDAADARRYAERYRRRHDDELMFYPYCMSRVCCCFCAPCADKVSVADYFTREEDRLRTLVGQEKETALNSPLGIAFVTFESINGARRAYQDHTSSIFQKGSRPESSVSELLKVHNWRVWFAPPASDIYWENLSVRRQWVLLKKFTINLLLFLVTFFLTTPQYIVNELEPILMGLLNAEVTLAPWITEFLPTLLLWCFTALLPTLVAYSDLWQCHWTRSGENHAIMKKTFWYLLFMVIILPTFGFTTGQAYVESLFKNSTDGLRWDCIFLPDSGAFFVNYVITAAMIGTGLELIRFPELIWYVIQICLSRSDADKAAIRRAITYEFRFGEQYARMMLMFAMTVVYSIVCPLIAPFGLLYFVLKHLVDRHNLAFVYAPNKINKKLHFNAINFVIMSVVMLQILMLIFTIVRSGNVSEFSLRTKYSFVLLFLTINVCFAHIWSNTCKKISPVKYMDVLLDEEGDDLYEVYLPDVLKD